MNKIRSPSCHSPALHWAANFFCLSPPREFEWATKFFAAQFKFNIFPPSWLSSPIVSLLHQAGPPAHHPSARLSLWPPPWRNYYARAGPPCLSFTRFKYWNETLLPLIPSKETWRQFEKRIFNCNIGRPSPFYVRLLVSDNVIVFVHQVKEFWRIVRADTIN